MSKTLLVAAALLIAVSGPVLATQTQSHPYVDFHALAAQEGAGAGFSLNLDDEADGSMCGPLWTSCGTTLSSRSGGACANVVTGFDWSRRLGIELFGMVMPVCRDEARYYRRHQGFPGSFALEW